MTKALSRTDYLLVNRSSELSVFTYAKALEGHTFREVLDLGIRAPGREKAYAAPSFKGGMGNLVEECYFGYPANSDDRPDFHECGVELKVTCIDHNRDGSAKAGERLVITMIRYDRPVVDRLLDSHLWLKMRRLLLVWYERDRRVDRRDQMVAHVVLFTPPPSDMPIIEEDYATITGLVRAGRAQELSESLTDYLGACTKGRTAASSWARQWYPPHDMAKRRAFCLKQPYMTYVLNHYVLGSEADADSIVKDPSELAHHGFREHVLSLVEPWRGMTDREMCARLGLSHTGNKAQWSVLVRRMLGVRTERAAEFEKAGINVRTVRVEADGSVRESLSLDPFEFSDLAAEPDFESSALFGYFESTTFLFVAFDDVGGERVLRGATFWRMPASDVEGGLRRCWQEAHDTVVRGVRLEARAGAGGRVTVRNDLPKASDNPVAHVRPHASHAAYDLGDGTVIGNVARDASELPDGRWMTRQSFWLDRGYVAGIVRAIPHPIGA